MNDLGRARKLLDAYRPGPGEVDRRGWEWRCLWQECRNDSLAEFCRYLNAVHSVAFSPDGNWVASGTFEGQLHLWRAPSWEEIADAEAVVGVHLTTAP